MTCPNCNGNRLGTHVMFDGSRPVSGFLCLDCGNKFAPAVEAVVEAEPEPEAEDEAEEPEAAPRTRRAKAAE